MQNLRFKGLMNLNLQEMFGWMKAPTHYLANSVQDFESNKQSIRPSLIHYAMPNSILHDYAVIIMHNITMDEETDQYGRKFLLETPGGHIGKPMVISDDTGATSAGWFEKPHAKRSYNDAQIAYGFKNGDRVDLVSLFYHIPTETSMVYDIARFRNQVPKKKLSLQELLELTLDKGILNMP